MPSDSEINCSFCGKSQEDVLRLISGSYLQEVFICNECVDLCCAIMADFKKKNVNKNANKEPQ